MKSFEDIQAWQKARILCGDVYKECKNCKDYGFKDQLQRASISILNNIAEGFERGGKKEFRQFLYIARGSCGEVRSMLRVGVDIGLIIPEKSEVLIEKSDEISRMLHGLIRALEKGDA